MSDELLKNLEKAIVEFDTDTAESLIKQAIKEEYAPDAILKALGNALNKVGELYDMHEYFLSELMLCGDTAKSAIEILKPYIAETETKLLGTIVFGTVKGDIHDIGKTIVSSFMIGAGFMVHDIGIEVSAAQFVSAVKKYKPDILAISALLSTTREYMRDVMSAMKRANLRDILKIIVGGRPVTPKFAKEIGADATATNPMEAVEICKKWMAEKQG
ncbi:MAG: cobalamin B12-binding domain-containing protein [Candidatus Helarchaeota archaeon]|nr:cobalamin B12-binding domain-containing protein [Candidatus Helarchaeota archaeon]